MRAEDTIQFMLDFYPRIFPTRKHCLNYLFCVIGNGYEWVNGELVDDDSKYLNRWTLIKPIEKAEENDLHVNIYKDRVRFDKEMGKEDDFLVSIR